MVFMWKIIVVLERNCHRLKTAEDFIIVNEELLKLQHQLEAERRINASFAELFQVIITSDLTQSEICEKVLNQARELTETNKTLEGKPAGFIASNKKLTEQYQALIKAEEKMRRSLEMQSVLREIAEAAVLLPSLNELYKAVHQLVGRVLPAKQFHINLLDEVAGEIVVPFNADDVTYIPVRRPIGRGMTEYIMRLGRAIHITPGEMNRLSATGEYALAKEQKVKMRHYLGAPLIDSQGKAFGVMSLIQMGEATTFQPEDVEVLSIIAAQVSMAIERKRAEEKMRRSLEMQSVLREIAEAAVLLSSLDELYKAVHQLVGRVLPAKQFHINLLDEVAGEIVVPFNADDITYIPVRRPIGRGMTEYIMRLGRAVHITPGEMKRLSAAGEYTLAKEQKVKTRHYLGAPLIDSQGKAFGVMSLIQMGEATTFQPEDVEVLSIVAAQVSMAIERKRMETELQTLATIDGLTGIYNRQNFLARAGEEFNRIARYGGTCSLIMIDIDHFKKVNDNFGHAVGDAAIRLVANLCNESLRGTDLLGRIGGEEFAMLLREAGTEKAEQIAERLRLHIQEEVFYSDQGVLCPLQVSIGISELHPSDETLSAVILRADRALYQAKNEGRNCVRVHS